MLSPIALKRALIAALIGLVLGALITEVPFLFLRETARAPMQVLLTIPKGTSELVARGEQPPSIPATMKFVVGDTLVVKNEDSVDHKLGPLWIPANASARLPLDEKDNLAFECSFQANNTLGLDIYEPLTPSMRILGMTSTGLPMAILFGLYALVMPVKKKEDPLAA
jgi:hypothetical protein